MKSKITKKTFDSVQFNHPLFVKTYNSSNPIDEYKNFCLEFAVKIKAKSIIDIGCGTGLLTCELDKQGYNLVGIEPAKPMLEIAKQSFCSGKIQWIKGLAKDLREYNADMAIMTGHVSQFHLTDKDWTEALGGIFTALKPGGYFIFESRNPNIHFWMPGKAQAAWQSSKENPNVAHDKTYGEMKNWIEFISFENNILKYKLYCYSVKQDKVAVSYDTLRFRTQNELTESLQSKGFEVKHVYGFWDKSPVTDNSPEFVFVARKKEF